MGATIAAIVAAMPARTDRFSRTRLRAVGPAIAAAGVRTATAISVSVRPSSRLATPAAGPVTTRAGRVTTLAGQALGTATGATTATTIGAAIAIVTARFSTSASITIRSAT